jgi:glycosyltransferase involved in cell wall biosynthesis
MNYEKFKDARVSIVLCTMRQHPKLEMLYQSLSHQTFQNFELIFVDELYDQRKDFVKQLSDKFHVRTTHIKGAIPNIHALNVGTINANGNYIVHINDCGYYPYRWLEKHLLIATNGFFSLGPRYFTYSIDFPIEKYYYAQVEVPPQDNKELSDFIKSKSGISEYLYLNFENHRVVSPQDLRLLGLPPLIIVEDNIIIESMPGWNHGGNSMGTEEMYFSVNGYDEEYDKGYGWADCDFSVRLSNKHYKSYFNMSNWMLEIQDKDHDDAENYVPQHKSKANADHNWKLYEEACARNKVWVNPNLNLDIERIKNVKPWVNVLNNDDLFQIRKIKHYSNYLDELYIRTIEMKPKLILELGRDVGRSTLAIALALRRNGFGKFISVDINPGIRTEDGSDTIKEQIDALHLTNMEFRDSESIHFLYSFKEKADLIFLDDKHENEHVLTELRLCKNILAENGIILIHDTKTLNSVPRFLEENPDFISTEIPHEYGLTLVKRK